MHYAEIVSFDDRVRGACTEQHVDRPIQWHVQKSQGILDIQNSDSFIL